MSKRDHATIYTLAELVRRMAARLAMARKNIDEDLYLASLAERYLRRNGFVAPAQKKKVNA